MFLSFVYIKLECVWLNPRRSCPNEVHSAGLFIRVVNLYTRRCYNKAYDYRNLIERRFIFNTLCKSLCTILNVEVLNVVLRVYDRCKVREEIKESVTSWLCSIRSMSILIQVCSINVFICSLFIFRAVGLTYVFRILPLV